MGSGRNGRIAALSDARAKLGLFLYGTLRDTQLLDTVLGRNVQAKPAVLDDYKTYSVAGENFPILTPEAGAKAEGIFLDDLSAEDIARLDFYEGPYAYTLRAGVVQSASGPIDAQFYMPEPGTWQTGAPWSLEQWQERYGPVKREAAHEITALFGKMSADDVAQRMTMIETRAQARVNARSWPKPVSLRSGLGRDDVTVSQHRQPYSHFFALEEVDLTHRQFNGETSPHMERAVFVSADAVTVLPYDPVRDRVLVIEQFRTGPYLRGDANPWLLEAIAGRLDAFETPQDTARREAREEAGLKLSALHRIGGYYPSPGANTEYLISYVAVTDLPDGSDGLGGLETEAEDIRSLLVGFDAIMAAVDSGEVDNGPLALSLYWLARHRDELRGLG